MIEDAKKHKYNLVMHLLSEGDAMVCLDARQPLVDVPAAHKANPALNLIFNLNFRQPIEVTGDGIAATLSFGGRPHRCSIPFAAVWAIYEPSSQKGQIWEESIPKDIDLSAQLQGVQPPPPQKVKGLATGGPSVVAGGKAPRPKRDRSHLRIIK